MKKSKANGVMFWGLIAIALGGVGFYAYNTTMNKLSEKKNADLQLQVMAETEEAEENTDSVQTEVEEISAVTADESESEDSLEEISDSEEQVIEEYRYEYTENYQCAIDFDELHAINPDIYGWIVINHMDISYPLLQHPTLDQHYLVYSYDDTPGNTGSIYTHTNQSRDMMDYNTIIYGHNLYQGGMFTDLEDYYDEEFLKEHRDIVIYQEDKALHYTVYAAVVYSDVLLDWAFDFNEPEDRQAFIESLSQTEDLRSHVMTDMEVTADDRLITLSTCSAAKPSSRLLIVAALTKLEVEPKE